MQGLLFGYVGPETLVPAASALAAIIGGLLAFGRTGLTLCSRVLRFVFGRRSGNSTDSTDDAQTEDQDATPAPSRRAA